MLCGYKTIIWEQKMKLINKLMMLLNKEVPTDVLVKRGMKVGCNFNRQQGCFLDPTHCYLIEIGDDVTMSIRVTVLTHDASTKSSTGYTKLGAVTIGDRVFIGANTTILPGVSIGTDAIVGACSVVTRDVPEGVVVAGNPARIICTVEEMKQKHLDKIATDKGVFDESYRMGQGLNNTKMMEIKKAISDGIAYIR
jgi:maltose O-acetyltransferase